MYSIQELEERLKAEKANYELIEQDMPIISTEDATLYYDIKYAAPTFILQSNIGLIACILSANHGKVDFEYLKNKFGYSKLRMADRKKIKKSAGYDIGAIPLVGLDLQCIFDDSLLEYDYIYGGTGNKFVTLKIDPNDVKRLNKVVGIL